jgi:hypothetical protein
LFIGGFQAFFRINLPPCRFAKRLWYDGPL